MFAKRQNGEKHKNYMDWSRKRKTKRNLNFYGLNWRLLRYKPLLFMFLNLGDGVLVISARSGLKETRVGSESRSARKKEKLAKRKKRGKKIRRYENIDIFINKIKWKKREGSTNVDVLETKLTKNSKKKTLRKLETFPPFWNIAVEIFFFGLR